MIAPQLPSLAIQKKTARMKGAALKLKQAGRLHNCMHKTPSLLLQLDFNYQTG